jgi:hypothetical protein
MKKFNNIVFTLVALPFPFTVNMDIFPIITAIFRQDKVEEVTVTIKDSSEKEEILWLARVIFSETKDVDEMEQIAWVVRNRVEDGRWGYSYKEVALSPSQFSGLNSWDAQYHININLDHDTNNSIWQKALVIAEEVYNANCSDRILCSSVKHFYSPDVVKTPSWAKNKKPVLITYNNVGRQTFKFYAGVR